MRAVTIVYLALHEIVTKWTHSLDTQQMHEYIAGSMFIFSIWRLFCFARFGVCVCVCAFCRRRLLFRRSFDKVCIYVHGDFAIVSVLLRISSRFFTFFPL